MRRTAVIIGIVLVLLAVAGVVVVVTTGGGDEGESAQERDERLAGEALESFATSFEAGDFAGAPLAGTAPAAATGEFEAITADLDAASVTVTPGAVGVTGDEATGTLTIDWVIAGDVAWPTATQVSLTREPEGPWEVVWAPTVVHPELGPGDRFVTERLAPERAAITGAGGVALVEERDVVVIGVQPSRVTDLDALTAELATLLDIDAAALAERVQAASPDAFVEVITLRREDYLPIRDQVRPLPGTVFREETLPLGPNRAFARALLGTSGPVTAEIIEASGGRYQAGDVAGLSGLQEEYDERLAGVNGVQVSIVRADPTPEGGTPSSTTTTAEPGVSTTIAPLEPSGPVVVFTQDPVPGQPVATTIDPVVQQAADDALASVELPSALVVVRPSTGEILAVANGPANEGGDLALTGRFPPGSSFKVVSTLAFLRDGLGLDDTVDCPATATVDGRTFSNAEDEVLGPVPFRTDFALSCNTAFVGLSDRLEPTTLTETARFFGIGRDVDIGTESATGSVPEAESDVELAAAAFGQGRTLVTPLDMAMVAGTVADGSWRPPLLVTDPLPTGQPTGAEPLPEGTAAQLQELMREVVTAGTGDAVADVPGGPVSGKTGTAEFGDDDPPRSHAWFIGFQGDLAFACFVEGGEFGGETAAPIVADLLTDLAG